MKGRVDLAIRLGGEAVTLRIAVDPALVSSLKKLYGSLVRPGRGPADLVVDAAEVRWKNGSREATTPRERLAIVEWAVASLAVDRISRRETVLHAAWIAIGRDSILLAGPHGAGKTTLALALELGGHGSVLSDDAIVVSGTGAIRPVERPLSIKPGAEGILSGVNRLGIDRGAWSEGLPSLLPSRPAPARPPKVSQVLLLEPGGGAVQAGELDEGSGVVSLAACAIGSPSRRSDAIKAAARVVRGCRILWMDGGSVAARVRAVQALTAEGGCR